MTVFAFGPRAELVLPDDPVWVDTPVGRACIYCLEMIGNLDRGLFVGYHDQSVNVAEPIHIECYDLAGIRGNKPNVDIACPDQNPSEKGAEEVITIEVYRLSDKFVACRISTAVGALDRRRVINVMQTAVAQLDAELEDE